MYIYTVHLLYKQIVQSMYSMYSVYIHIFILPGTVHNMEYPGTKPSCFGRARVYAPDRVGQTHPCNVMVYRGCPQSERVTLCHSVR